jgi:hypothetical protein
MPEDCKGTAGSTCSGYRTIKISLTIELLSTAGRTVHVTSYHSSGPETSVIAKLKSGPSMHLYTDTVREMGVSISCSLLRSAKKFA